MHNVLFLKIMSTCDSGEDFEERKKEKNKTKTSVAFKYQTLKKYLIWCTQVKSGEKNVMSVQEK